MERPKTAKLRSVPRLGRQPNLPTTVDRVTAIVPVRAETGSLREVVSGLVEHLGERLLEVRVVLAADAPVATQRVCRELMATFDQVCVSEQRRNPGLGWAVRQGIDEANGAYLLLMDGDGEMDVTTVPLMVEALESVSADMVVASRWAQGGGAIGYHRLKLVLNRVFQLLFRLLYRTSLHDLTLGFKLARAEVLKEQRWAGEFHEIACETTLRPIRSGYLVIEVPTVWRRRSEGKSSNPFRRNFRYVAMAFAILLDRAGCEARQ